MKITRKILENIIIEETEKLFEQDLGVLDFRKNESRPMLSNDEIRLASMQELEEEYLGFGCKTVSMSSSDGAITYCRDLETAYEEKALQKGMSAETLRDISEQIKPGMKITRKILENIIKEQLAAILLENPQPRPTANDKSISTIAFRQEVLRQLQYIVDKLIIDRDATLGTKAKVEPYR